jgi:hypothetical protein
MVSMTTANEWETLLAHDFHHHPHEIDFDPEPNELTTTYTVYLVRFMLSYSTSCPSLVHMFFRLYKEVVPLSWLSHYAIRLGDYYFDLYREDWVAFASVAYFRIVDSKHDRQMDRGFGTTLKCIDEDLKTRHDDA